MADNAALLPEDLVSDRALREQDPDRFDHEAIAGQVSHLIRQVDMPSNIALFGPWGSGKSSFFELLRRHLEGDGDVVLVYYDAWKFGGRSLLRNLISHAAGELTLDAAEHARFHRGLYESHRTVDIDYSKIRSGRRILVALFTLGVSLVASALLIFLVAAAVTLGSDATRLGDALADQLVFLSPRLAIPVAAAVLAVLAIDLLKIESEKSAPTEAEEFHRTFTDLVEAALVKHEAERLVVFIDELDRCSAQDVAATLTHLKTFLGNDRCVFVVAADRSVVEEGLEASALSRPVTEDEPYYSSASGYLDKIFQHQFALPPLRGTKLNTFAYELAEGSGGLWAEIRSESQSSFDDLMYALIPTHVRSPRRVKVLLNNFATTARVAHARGINWKQRATELAKLTVLQTEYPMLARDLHLENRLPTLLIDPPDTPTQRQQELLAKHDLDADEPDRTGSHAVSGDAVPPDRLLSTASDNTSVRRRQRDELRRYLHRTSTIPDPGRDLLFLDALGASAGLDDRELSRILEEDAPEDPTTAIDALGARPLETQVVGLRVLSETSERERGRDQANLIRVITHAAEGLEIEDLRGVAPMVLAAIRSYKQRTELEDRDLPGALRIAVAAGSSGSTMAARLAGDDRLLASSELVTRAIDLLDHLDEGSVQEISDTVGELWAAGEPEPMLRAIEVLDEGLKPLLVRVRPTLRSFFAVQTPEEQRESSTRLLEALLERDDNSDVLSETTIYLLELRAPGVYDAVNDAAAELLTPMSPDEQNRVSLTALLTGPAKFWTGWTEALSADSGSEVATLVREVVIGLISRFAEAPTSTQTEVPEILSRVLVVDSPQADESFWKEIQEVSTAALGASNWWTSEDAQTRQRTLHETLLTLRERVPSGEAVIDGVLVDDLARSLSGLSDATSIQLRALRRLTAHVPTEVAVAIDQQVPDLTTPAGKAQVTATRALLRGLAAREHPTRTLPAADVAAAISQLTAERGEILASWLATKPTRNAVLKVARQMQALPRTAIDALASWAAQLNEGQRTALAASLLRAPDVHADWLTCVVRPGVREATVARRAGELLAKEGRWQDRERIVKMLDAMELKSQGARRALADAAIFLLETGKGVDIGIAVELVPQLGDGYGRKKTLTRALKSADLSALNRSQIRTLEDADLVRKSRIRRALEMLDA